MIRPAPKTNKENYSTIQIRVACNYHIQLNFFCSLKTDRDCRWTDNLNIMFDLGYWNKECILLQCIFFNIKKYLSNRVIYFKFINLYQYFAVLLLLIHVKLTRRICAFLRESKFHTTRGDTAWTTQKTGLPKIRYPERERERDRQNGRERETAI